MDNTDLCSNEPEVDQELPDRNKENNIEQKHQEQIEDCCSRVVEMSAEGKSAACESPVFAVPWLSGKTVGDKDLKPQVKAVGRESFHVPPKLQSELGSLYISPQCSQPQMILPAFPVTLPGSNCDIKSQEISSSVTESNLQRASLHLNLSQTVLPSFTSIQQFKANQLDLYFNFDYYCI